MARPGWIWWVGCLVLVHGSTAEATIYNGNPGNYLTFVNQLQAGDTLILAPGTYTGGLTLNNKNGTGAAPIIIVGPESGPAAVFHPRPCCNTVSITNSSYLEIRNLEVDGLGMPGIDAVKAEGPQGDANFAHHITLENLLIHGHDGDQSTVGISTKCPAWDWVVRRNVINSAGTGMYFGNSDGSAPFVNSLIEGNLVVDTIGYNVQIKHQNDRPALPGMPSSGVTTIRHNVFSKANNASTGADARPNLLVGHWPLSGPGSSDYYQIYGNFFWANPTGEALFQGEGRVGLYQNLFVNNTGPAVVFQPQNDAPRWIYVFRNTVVATTTGIRVSGVPPGGDHVVMGNASFAATPITAAYQFDNVTGTYAAAGTFLTNPAGSPTGSPSQLDLYPRPGMLNGTPLKSPTNFLDWERDFNGVRHTGRMRGAYAGAGTNPGWLPRLERKAQAADLVADVALTISDSPDPVLVGTLVTFTVTVTNLGPDPAVGCNVVIDLPFPFFPVSPNPPPPICTIFPVHTVNCVLADLPPGGSATITLSSNTPSEPATVTSNAFVITGTDDPNAGNGSDTEVTTVVPTMSIGDVTVAETNGMSFASFPVTLSTASNPFTVTANYATADGTATAGQDYGLTAGTLVIPPGATSGVVTVPILGDRVDEAAETLFVNLNSPTFAFIADGQGQATLNDDDPPGLSIADVAAWEARFGPASANFLVTLSPASSQTVTVDYATIPGTATAGADYTAVSGQLTFAPGVPMQPMGVPILSDTVREGTESFTVRLSGAVNATIAYPDGIGRIQDPPPGADFNADRLSDLVWRHDVSGQNAVWFMNGADLISGTFTNPGLADPNWKIVGTNDFSADGRADFLWRHLVSGENVVWFLDGVTLTGGTFTTPSALADVNWKMVGTGDFNLDGQADILWRHDVSGENVLWYMNGTVLTGGTFTSPSAFSDLNWKMAGVGDFNRDGKPDILWHHRFAGQLVLWYMDGSVLINGAFTSPSGPMDVNWIVVAVADYNADERPDIVWRHQASGQLVIWFMDGPNRIGATFTNPPAVPDLNWKLVGPR